MTVGVLKERFPGESRVALIPATIAPLRKAGVTVLVEADAGTAAGYPDELYKAQGAEILPSRSDVIARADTLVMVRTPGANPVTGRDDAESLRSGQTIVGLADPLGTPEAAEFLATKGVTLFALELIPRITRAQSMDVLSSMASIAGYKAVLLAATALPRMCPMMMTAAGTINPAHAFVIGAGVAGLQAIASARRLGARVEAYDVRPAVKEQIQSLGAKFLELPLEIAGAEDKGGYATAQDESFYRRQREMMAKAVATADIVITTAAVPGKKSPVLITADMVKGMKPGSVIVDLAAERGGNCELTKADETVAVNGVTILGPTNLPATVPYHASQMYSRNVLTFLQHLMKDGALTIDANDEITRETLVTQAGRVVNERIKGLLATAS
jgi:NAD(P) transhydrogenase subunit alpha